MAVGRQQRNILDETCCTFDFYTLDVFTSTRFKGNPLAVICGRSAELDALSQEQKQKLAKEFNLSETVLLYEEGDVDTDSIRADIFTTTRELSFAGHPTIGTAVLTSLLGYSKLRVLELKAGPVYLSTHKHDDASSVVASQSATGWAAASVPHSVHVHKQTLGDILGVHGISTKDIEPHLSVNDVIKRAELEAPAVSITDTMTFFLIELPDRKHLTMIDDSPKTMKLNASSGLLDNGIWDNSFVARYYYVCDELQAGPDGANLTLSSRMIEFGFEDAATGSAACALSSYLALTVASNYPQLTCKFTQGEDMGQRSDIEVTVDTIEHENQTRAVQKVVLKGSAVVVSQGRLNV